jgi:hypothetical protein
MRRPPCICNHPDARQCLANRMGVPAIGFDRFESEVVGLAPDERCDCGCHLHDEDGRDGWDDSEAGDD